MQRRLFSTRSLLILASSVCWLSLASQALAEIDYKVTIHPDKEQLLVDMIVPSGGGPVSIQMGNWMPGAYVYSNQAQNVTDVSADAKGKALTVSHPDKNTWTVDSSGNGPIHFEYTVPIRGQRRFAQGADSGFVQIAGPATYMYVVHRKLEPCKVTFAFPSGWPIAVGLDEAKGEPNTYVAPFYDVLADNPVSTGSDIVIDSYNLRGKDHYIVLEGPSKSKVDRAKLLKDCRFVSAAETDFWGSVPYHKYVWHFIVYDGKDGGGGLEHLDSTQISLSSGEGPRAQSVLAHEYFHLWNVKRSRPKVLGPFDYLVLPKTGNLWWYEGVTDYYASLIPYRYGEWNRDMFFDAITRNMTAVRTNPVRLEISPYQASYRVGEANNGRGNSNGYEISYYNLGWLCGMCLDLEIRAQTGGRHSLDDVARALYDECKNFKPGIEEDEIRKQCIRFGGPALGPFYDKVVMSPGELPLEEELAKAGLKIVDQQESYVDIGFRAAPGFGGGGVRVAGIHGPAEGQLQTGDLITMVNGKSVSDRTALTPLAEPVAGASIGLTVTRDGNPVEVTITPVAAERKVHKIIEDVNANPAAVSLRNQWLATKAPSVP